MSNPLVTCILCIRRQQIVSAWECDICCNLPPILWWPESTLARTWGSISFIPARRQQPEKPPCPQLGIITVVGDLYFGAVNHVEELIRAHMERHPGQRFLLLRMQNVNRMDI